MSDTGMTAVWSVVVWRWCQRLALVCVVLGLVWLGTAVLGFTQASAVVPTQDQSALWAQLLTAGVVLGVGVWAIRTFLAFKDEAIKQAEQDRQQARQALDEVKETLASETHETGQKVLELTHALMGIGGRGGLLTDRDMDQKRRHELGNHVHRLTLVVAEILKIQAEIARRLDIPVDPNLGRAIDRPEHER